MCVSIYRVSYCTVDPYYDKVFCYISRNHENKQLECHAFLCSKKSKAEAITLTVAQAFNIAFERWQAHKKRKEDQKKARENVAAAAATLASISADNGAPPQQTNPDIGEYHNCFNIVTQASYYWGERSETLLSDERCNSVCMCVCVYVCMSWTVTHIRFCDS